SIAIITGIIAATPGLTTLSRLKTLSAPITSSTIIVATMGAGTCAISMTKFCNAYTPPNTSSTGTGFVRQWREPAPGLRNIQSITTGWKEECLVSSGYRQSQDAGNPSSLRTSLSI